MFFDWSRRFGRRGTLSSRVILLVSVACGPAAAEPQFPGPLPTPADIAVTNVNLIAMTRPEVLPAQTVVMRGDRIVAVGPAETMVLRPGTIKIDGSGRFLLPGLVDAHVHLDGDGTFNGSTRPDFGDGPLYLRFGVTTVFNLAGTAVHLDWRQRIEAANALSVPQSTRPGPSSTSRACRTPRRRRAGGRRQALAGFDLVKFHELYGPGRLHDFGSLTRCLRAVEQRRPATSEFPSSATPR